MSFDQLKREAVNLERQLEDKVSRYQQVCHYEVHIHASKHDLILSPSYRVAS
jgi:hypothetical protein